MKVRKALHILAVLLFLASFCTINVSSSPLSPPDAVQALQQATGGRVRISYHAETGKVRFIGTDQAHPIAQPAQLAGDVTPEVAARSFLATYGGLFGLTDPAQELSVMRARTLDEGGSMVRFQQVYRGIPVLGGELIVNMDSARDVLSANGEVLPDIGVSTAPALDAEAARRIALQKVAKDNDLEVSALTATQPELWVYNPVLLGGTGPKVTSLVWRTEVEAKELLPIRELVLVEAHLGFVVLHFNQIDTALSRTVFDNQNNPNENLALFPAVCTEGVGCTGAGTDDDFAYNFAADTYNFYNTYHSRDSLDGAGLPLISTVRYCPASGLCPYPNAFWNGAQMVYGADYASADDVVGHEMTHGVTDHESRLFYYMQSGAINESFSDIWGEFIDQTNATNGSGGGILWRMGEDLPIGAIRSMQDPTIYGDPDRMGSPNYHCGTDDFGSDDMGGVHTNSGVSNKAAYLMANGGSFQGYNVAPLGIAKTAKIFYKVQTDLFTSASDYQDLYDDLQQACTALIGTVTTPADCQEVKDAVDATQMNQQPASCAANEAPVCPTDWTESDIFFDNLENPASGNWISTPVSAGPNEWYYPQNSHLFDFDATYATSGVTNFWGYDLETAAGDYAMSMTSNVTLPPGSNPFLRFRHAFGFENGNYDGGVVEYSLDGGGWTNTGGLSAVNGYNGTISSASNALNTRPAFVNNSNGYISTRLSLSSLAGHNVKFRFRLGTDVAFGDWGWFIDDVRIYTCTSGAITNPVFLPVVIRSIPAPSAPTNLVAAATSSTAIHLTWNDTTNETGYRLQRSPDGSTWSPLITLPANTTSYDNTGLTASTLYYYRIVAYNSTGDSAWSNTAFATTLPISLPVNFNSVADAGILEGYATSNFGTATDMWAGYDDYLEPDGLRVRSLVKFDVSAIPPGTSINSATLNVYYAGHWDFPSVSRTITAYRPGSDWSEMAVTWNNAPAPSTAYGSVAVVSDSNWRYVSIDVTNLVRGWLNGSIANYGIMLRGPEGSGSDSSWRSFTTREAGLSYTPKLVVTYPAGVAAPGSAPSGENPSGGQTILQATTGQAYNPLAPAACQPAAVPGAPEKCLSTR